VAMNRRINHTRWKHRGVHHRPHVCPSIRSSVRPSVRPFVRRGNIFGSSSERAGKRRLARKLVTGAQITNGPPPWRSASIPFQERRAKLNKVLRPGRFRLRGGATTLCPSSSACRFVGAKKRFAERTNGIDKFQRGAINRGNDLQGRLQTSLTLSRHTLDFVFFFFFFPLSDDYSLILNCIIWFSENFYLFNDFTKLLIISHYYYICQSKNIYLYCQNEE